MITIAIYIVILSVALVAVFRCPSTAIALLLCMFGLEQWAQSSNSFFIVYGKITNIIVASIVGIAFAINIGKRRPILYPYPKVGWFVISLFFYAFISTLWTPVSEITYGLWMKHLPYLIIIILLSPLLIDSNKSLSEVFLWLLPMGTIIILLLLFDANWTYHGVQLLRPDGRRMAENPLIGNPLAPAQMAGYIVLSVVNINFPSKWHYWKYVRWGIVAICLALAVKSASRGQFISMFAVAIIFLPLSRPINNYKNIFALLFGLLFIVIIGSWAFDNFSMAGDKRWNYAGIEGDYVGRINNTMKLLENWYRSPSVIFFGLGNSASFDPRIIGYYPHIVILEILGEEGLIGLCLFLSILWYTIKSIINVYNNVINDPEKRGLLAVVASIFCFEFILSFKQGSMLGNHILFAIAIIIGRWELLIIRDKKLRMVNVYNPQK